VLPLFFFLVNSFLRAGNYNPWQLLHWNLKIAGDYWPKKFFGIAAPHPAMEQYFAYVLAVERSEVTLFYISSTIDTWLPHLHCDIHGHVQRGQI